MKTQEAYEHFKAGKRVGVVVTTLWPETKDVTIQEIDDNAWKRRIHNTPDHTNYVFIEDPEKVVKGDLCGWLDEAGDDSIYSTECGNEFQNLDDGLPITQWATFCPYCSKRIAKSIK